MESPQVRRKIEDDENKQKRSVNDESLGAVTGTEHENTSFVRNQQQQTKEMKHLLKVPTCYCPTVLPMSHTGRRRGMS